MGKEKGSAVKRVKKKEMKKKRLEKQNKWRGDRKKNLIWKDKIETFKRTKKSRPEYTLKTNFNLRRRVLIKTQNKRAKRAVRDIKRYVRKNWKVREVKIDTDLNKYLWSNGRRNPPRKVRLVIQRKRRDDDEEKQRQDKYYCDVGMEMVADWTDNDKLKPESKQEEYEEEDGEGEEKEEMKDEDEDAGEEEGEEEEDILDDEDEKVKEGKKE